MDSRHLDYIVAIAEEKNISRAAARLFSTQPALSQYLLLTEERLGTPLFRREKNAMILTRAGEIYVQAAREILNIGQQTDTLLADIKNLKKGRIRLGISQERGSVVLPNVLPVFYRKYPGIPIEIVQNTNRNLEAAAVQGNIDIVIFPIVKPIKDYSELDYETLCRDELLLVVPKAHRLAGLADTPDGRRPVVDIRLFQDDPFCLKNKGSNIRVASDAVFKNFGIIPVIQFETTNTYAVCNTAVKTGTLAFIPETLSRFSKLDRNCVYFSIDPERSSTTIIAAYRKGTYLNQATRDLIQMLKDFFSSIVEATNRQP